MAPCNCGEKMSGQFIGLVKMRFIGKPDGVLMKGAPGYPYEHGKIYSVPAKYSQWKFWEFVESPPEIRAPEPKKEDSVFKDEIFLPPSEIQAASILPPNETTSSIAPTPVINLTLQVGEVTQSTPEPKATTPEESAVTQEVPHDDKPVQVKESVVMESLTDDDDDNNEMPPELIAEMRSLGEELPGEQPPQRRRGRKPRVLQ